MYLVTLTNKKRMFTQNTVFFVYLCGTKEKVLRTTLCKGRVLKLYNYGN